MTFHVKRAASVLFGCVAAGAAWAAEVVLPEKPTPAEQTAADEVRRFLASATAFTVAGEEARIHVGDTPLAAEHGLSPETLEDEAWAVRSFGRDVAIVGGGPRGTLYAASHFIEDVLGGRYLAFDAEHLPPPRDIRLDALAMSGRPFFRMRDIYRTAAVADGGRFALLRRLNRDGDNDVAPAYGDAVRYGRPYHAHTFNYVIPAAAYLKTHPEFFSLRGGKRVGGEKEGQLCLANEAMRRFYLERQLEFIRQDEEAARAAGLEPPRLYDVSANDNHNPCQCADCKALAQRAGGQAGALIDFVNFLADEIAKVRPDIQLATLAYFFNEAPPKNIRPRQGVVVRLCDTRTNQAQPFSRQPDRKFIDRLAAWGGLADTLGVWDYSVTYGSTAGLPYPHEYALAEDVRTYAAHKVAFLFYEHEYPHLADMYDYAVYLETRLMEDPGLDAEAVGRDFLEKYYGAAAPAVEGYRRLIKESADRRGGFVDWFATFPAHYSHMDADTVAGSHRLFDEAEAAVADDEELLARVRRARLPLDRITYMGDGYLAREWAARGRDAADWPLDKAAVMARARGAWEASIRRVMAHAPEKERSRGETWRQAMEKEMALYAARPRILLAETPTGPWKTGKAAYFMPVDMGTFRSGQVGLVEDADALGGWAARYAPEAGKSALPLVSGGYNNQTHDGYKGAPITKENVAGAGYHWYKVADIRLDPSQYANYFPKQALFLPLSPAADSHPRAKAEVWIRAKATGADAPGGQPGDPEAAYLDMQAVIVR